MMEQRSKNNHATFRILLAGLKDSPKAEKLVRDMLSGMMENCPKELLVKVGEMVVNYNLEEWKLYDARN